MKESASRPLLGWLSLVGCALALAPIASAAVHRSARIADSVLAAVVLTDERLETREEALAAIVAAGGVVTHAFDGLLVVEAPRDSVRSIARCSAVADATTETLSPSRHARRRESFQAGLGSWNRFFKNQGSRFASFAHDGEPAPAPDGPDSFSPPAPAAATVWESGPVVTVNGGFGPVGGGAAIGLSSSATQPYGATDQNTSEFLAGSVSVNLFLPESGGSVDLSTENWTADREQAVVAQIAAGLDWVRTMNAAASLSFVYHVIAGRTDARAKTGYEPIARKADPMGTTGEDLWVNEILTNMGYSIGDRWTRSRALANATRRADGTDWGVNVFVVDSLSDADGKFADGYFAYAWVGGPHIVMTYDNQLWGITRMNQVTRHEILHSFFAFDEYSVSGCNCTEHRGYLDGTNGSCRTCNAAAATCVMDSNGAAMCDNTRRQLGWADLDGDGADDVIGEDPVATLDALPASVCGAVAFSGQGAVVAASNRNVAGYTPTVSISVNRVSEVEWRVDGGAWLPTSPSDGAWGDYVEACSAAASLSVGTHLLEVRVVDDHGNVDLAPPQATIQVLLAAADPGNVLQGARGTGDSATLSWNEAPAAVKYRVYRSSQASGGFVLAAETIIKSWVDTAAGNGYYRLREVDACGGESVP